MSFLTVEVELDHGRISPKGTEKLPEKAVGLLTILSPEPTDIGGDRSTLQRPYGLARGLFEVPESFNEPLPLDLLGIFEGQ
jgi:hypothetical protein